MTRATFSVLFYIKRTKKLRDGTSPIYARITVNGKRAEFGLQRSIETNEWDKRRGYANGHSKKARELNSYIDFVKGKLHQYRIDIEEQGKPFTAILLKNTYLGIDDEGKSILQVFKVSRPEFSLHFLLFNPVSNLQFIFNPISGQDTCSK